MNSPIRLEIDENNLIIFMDYKVISSGNLKIFKRMFQCQIDEESHIIKLPNAKEQITKVIEFFDKIEVNFVLDDVSNRYIKRKIQQNTDFKNFSKKAKEIWNKDFSSEEFSSFSCIINTEMERTLYEKQLLSAYHLAFSQNACNFSVPGAGKTSIVYGAYCYLNSLEPDDSKYVNKILIIGPLSCFKSWIDEYESCFGFLPTVERLSGNTTDYNSKKNYLYSRNTSVLTLISYQGVIGCGESLKYFLENNRVMVVLDEAHKIKNTDDGIIAKTILGLADKCCSRVVLTGTPAPNGYQDLYNLIKFIWPDKNIIKYSPAQLEQMNKNEKDARINGFIEGLTPYFIRIKREDLSLPPKIDNPPFKINMDKKQESIYAILEKKYISSFNAKNENDSLLDKFQKAKLIRLMQAANNPHLLLKPLEHMYGDDFFNSNVLESDENLYTLIVGYKNITPPKFRKAKELIEKIISKGERVVIWAIYIDTINEFSNYLNTFAIKNKILYGKTPNDSDDENIETRERIICEFNSNCTTFNVIIANPFAVAESISIHKYCHNAIYLERSFDAARYLQSKDRIYRYGLQKDVITKYYYLETKDTIDETISKRLTEKEKLMLRIMETNEIPLFHLDEVNDDDLKQIIADYEERKNGKTFKLFAS